MIFVFAPRLEGTAQVVMKVNGAAIVIELEGDKAPITAGNVDLVQESGNLQPPRHELNLMAKSSSPLKGTTQELDF